MIFLHPRTTTLVRYALDDGYRPARLRRHLEGCGRCRAVVVRSRDVGTHARTAVPTEFDTGALWSRIQSRQQESALILLPTSPVVVRDVPRRFVRTGAAGVAAALVFYVMMGGNAELAASAASGTLVADTMNARPGSAIAIRYSAPAMLASAPSVVARVAFYGDPPRTAPVDTTALLHRTGEGTFAGILAIPRFALVARLTVASIDGRSVDDNHGRAWEIVSRDAAGRPLFDALFAQYANLDQGEWEKGYRIVEQMVMHHPSEPKGWRFHASQSLELAGPAARDSVRATIQPALDRLHTLFRDGAATSDRAWEMAMFGSTIGDTAKSRFWRHRLLAEHPRSAGATQFRVWEITASTPDLRRRITAFDSLYVAAGASSAQLMYDAFNAAIATGDSAIMSRWGDRMLESQPGSVLLVGAQYVKVPALRAEGLRRLRETLAQHPIAPAGDWVASFERGPATSMGDRQRQSLLMQVGTGLAAMGRHAAAYDTLRRAAALGRTPSAARRLADAALAVGDTTAAVRAWAWLAADPRTPDAGIDSASASLNRWMETAEFTKWKEQAAASLNAEMLATAFHRRLGEPVTLAKDDGSAVPLEMTLGKQLTVVAFISRWCAPSITDLASLDAVARQLATRGIPLIAVIKEEPTPVVRAAYRKRGWSAELHYDKSGSAERAFRAGGTPAYYVVTTEDTAARFLARQATDLLLMTAAAAGR